jgi:hypothetical protein
MTLIILYCPTIINKCNRENNGSPKIFEVVHFEYIQKLSINQTYIAQFTQKTVCKGVAGVIQSNEIRAYFSKKNANDFSSDK